MAMLQQQCWDMIGGSASALNSLAWPELLYDVFDPSRRHSIENSGNCAESHAAIRVDISSYRNCGSSAVSYTCGGEVLEHQKGITPLIDIAMCGSSCES